MTSYIGHTNKIPNGTVTVTSEVAGFEKENAHDWLSYDFWKATTDGNVYYTIDFGSAVSIDSWGCAFHDLADHSGTVKPQYSNDNFSTDVNDFDAVQTPSDASIIFRIAPSVSARYWRFEFWSTGVANQIGDLFFGEALALPFGMRIGFISPENNRNTKVSNNISKGGALLGRSVHMYGEECQIRQDYAQESWVDANWLTLIKAIETHAFYFLWDESNRPTEAAYCWTSKPVENPSYLDYGATDSYLTFNIPVQARVE